MSSLLSTILTDFDFLNFLVEAQVIYGNNLFTKILRAIAVALAACGAYFFLNSFVPAVIHTYKTKNTVGINKLMFILHMSVGGLFFTGALVWCTECCIQTNYANKNWYVDQAAAFGDYKPDLILTATIFIVNNGVNGSGMIYILSTKLKNERLAKEAGMTEAEYYEKHIAPTLNN